MPRGIPTMFVCFGMEMEVKLLGLFGIEPSGLARVIAVSRSGVQLRKLNRSVKGGKKKWKMILMRLIQEMPDHRLTQCQKVPGSQVGCRCWGLAGP